MDYRTNETAGMADIEVLLGKHQGTFLGSVNVGYDSHGYRAVNGGDAVGSAHD